MSLSPRLSSLPYDIYLDLFAYLDSIDIFNLLCSSKLIYSYITDERIWRMLASRCGVTDISAFQPDYTWHDVYTGLLHKYGGLLGLWASDYAYRGNILECRINEDGNWPGIICEVWQFALATDQHNSRDPWLPSYVESFHIRLNRPDTEDDSKASCYATLHWYSPAHWYPETRSGVTPSLLLLSETNQASFIHVPVQGFSCISQFPDFPPENAAWYDNDNTLPRLSRELSHEHADPKKFFTKDALEPSCYLYLDTVDCTFPAALSFDIPEGCHAQLTLHQPYIPRFFDDFRYTYHPQDRTSLISTTDRYYPLRRSPPLDNNPSMDWSPQRLVGIWLGAYGPHGTEVLYIDWQPQSNEVWAWKITGDFNVPRGAITWRFNVNDGGNKVPAGSFGDLKPSASFCGIGTISSVGFLEYGQDQVPMYIAICGQNEIYANWLDMSIISRYRRYMGRQLSSEVVNGSERKPVFGL
ncbi:hypothetical protein QCA50_003692 [Cerrena zonata]|uniref:F-box domain-containing protein n=1 Tax=Cerrena zonata TaxID=2478898 RepID=A0AAW0GL02_9APHY